MRRTLSAVKPTVFEDIIALNALYRPVPMDNIPMFGRRKNGHEEIEYPHALLEGILKETYGIFVYQEQVMQAAQILAGSRSEEHTSALQSLMRISYAVFCLNKIKQESPYTR